MKKLIILLFLIGLASCERPVRMERAKIKINNDLATLLLYREDYEDLIDLSFDSVNIKKYYIHKHWTLDSTEDIRTNRYDYAKIAVKDIKL